MSDTKSFRLSGEAPDQWAGGSQFHCFDLPSLITAPFGRFLRFVFAQEMMRLRIVPGA